jgi:colanic acid/amylovoran biosynthesis glycosyltransferase
MPAARRAGIRHVVTFYGLDVNFLPRHDRRWRGRYAELFGHVDAVLCEGPHMAGEIAALGCPEEKIRVQRLGVSFDDIPYEPCAWRPGEPLRVLIAASFREKKGIPDALEAIARLQESVPLEVTLIGDAGEDPRAQDEKPRILSAIERFNLGDKVCLLGYQPHARLLEEARRHHIFLAPSLTASDGDTEGGAPVSLIEMAASGMLIVSTTHCDIPEIVRHGETGLLSAERDIDGLVRNLQWLLAHTDRWDAMRTAARKHVEAGFDARRQAERLARIYRALIG